MNTYSSGGNVTHIYADGPNNLTITVELVDVRSGFQMWAESYDRDLADIFAIQADVAEQIASALNARLAPDERRNLEERPTDALGARRRSAGRRQPCRPPSLHATRHEARRAALGRLAARSGRRW